MQAKTILLKFWVALLGVVGPAVAQSNLTPIKIVRPPAVQPLMSISDGGIVMPRANLDLLIGYDSNNGDTTGAKCVEYKEALPQLARLPAQQVVYDGDQGSSIERFMSQQNVTASASLGIGRFKADSNFALLKSGQLSSFSEYLRLTVTVTNAKQLLDVGKVSLSDKGRQAKSRGTFAEDCGDSFIIGQITGGEFSVVYLSSSNSAAEQQSMKASLSAAYAGFGAKAKIDAALSEEMDRVTKDGRLTLRVLRQGDNEKLESLSVADLISYARVYNEKVRDKPWTVAYITASYRAVADAAETNKAGFADLERQARIMRQHYQRLSGLNYMIKSAGRVGSSEFGSFSVARAIKERDELQTKIDRYAKEIQKCVDDKSVDCKGSLDDASVTDVPERAERIDIDPKFEQWRRIATVVGNDAVIVENRGTYSDSNGAPGSKQGPTSPRNRWCFTNRLTGESNVVHYKRPMKIPSDTIAYFGIQDGPHYDNIVDPRDPPYIVTYRPLYADEHAYPDRGEKDCN